MHARLVERNGVTLSMSGGVLCATCGTQFQPGTEPDRCPICEDDRQYVLPAGQNWTSIEELSAKGHANVIRDLDAGVYSIETVPRFGIGQRAMVIRTSHGNLLWDCISFLDDETISQIEKRGGITAIAVSHPHFYSSMVTWSKTFSDAPIYLPESAREWVFSSNENIRLWEGSTQRLWPDLSLHRTGGHFACSQVALWESGAGGRGCLFSADEPMVNPGCDSVSLMHSFPNSIPLDVGRRNRVLAVLAELSFDRIYGGWQGREITTGAKQVIEKSVNLYDRIVHAEAAADQSSQSFRPRL
jgi:hypothetical protein